MTIRHATRADVPRLVVMGTHFLRASVYRDRIAESVEQMTATVAGLLDNPEAAVLVGEDGGAVRGMLVVFCYVHPLSAERVAGELVWWVEPEARGRLGLALLRAAEQWAVAQGARRIQMIAPEDPVGRLYERFGYDRIEVHYQRTLP